MYEYTCRQHKVCVYIHVYIINIRYMNEYARIYTYTHARDIHMQFSMIHVWYNCRPNLLCRKKWFRSSAIKIKTSHVTCLFLDMDSHP